MLEGSGGEVPEFMGRDMTGVRDKGDQVPL